MSRKIANILVMDRPSHRLKQVKIGMIIRIEAKIRAVKHPNDKTPESIRQFDHRLLAKLKLIRTPSRLRQQLVSLGVSANHRMIKAIKISRSEPSGKL